MRAAKQCVPYALGKVTGRRSWDIAGQLIEDGGHSMRKRSFRRTEYIPLLKELGVKVTAELRAPHMTTVTFDRIRLRQADTSAWLVQIAGHLLVYRRGAIYDNSHPAGISAMLWHGRKCPIRNAWQVDAWNEADPFREV